MGNLFRSLNLASLTEAKKRVASTRHMKFGRKNIPDIRMTLYFRIYICKDRASMGDAVG